MKDIHWSDIIPWSRLGAVGGIIASTLLLLASHFHHVQILTKVAANSQLNWNVTNGEMFLGIGVALISVVVSWRATTGMTTIQQVKKAEAAPVIYEVDESSEVLLEKFKVKFRQEAADDVRNRIMGGITR